MSRRLRALYYAAVARAAVYAPILIRQRLRRHFKMRCRHFRFLPRVVYAIDAAATRARKMLPMRPLSHYDTRLHMMLLLRGDADSALRPTICLLFFLSCYDKIYAARGERMLRCAPREERLCWKGYAGAHLLR